MLVFKQLLTFLEKGAVSLLQFFIECGFLKFVFFNVVSINDHQFANGGSSNITRLPIMPMTFSGFVFE